jgi:hypothetical protein
MEFVVQLQQQSLALQKIDGTVLHGQEVFQPFFQHVILTANYNTEIHGNIDACQMTVNSGVTLDIMDGTDGTYVYVVNSIFNNGTINVNSKANLVQVNHPLDLNDETIVTPSINFSKNAGDKIRWDYVYWGKPIADNILSAYNANFDIKYYWDPDFAGIGQSYLGWRVLNSEPTIGMGFITRVKNSHWNDSNKH